MRSGCLLLARYADVEDAGAGAAFGEAVGLVVEVAALQAQAAAADAAVELVEDGIAGADAVGEAAANAGTARAAAASPASEGRIRRCDMGGPHSGSGAESDQRITVRHPGCCQPSRFSAPDQKKLGG